MRKLYYKAGMAIDYQDRLQFDVDIQARVRAIVEDVKTNGDKALCAYTKRFDGAFLTDTSLFVSEEEKKVAMAVLDKDIEAALMLAKKNIEAYQTKYKAHEESMQLKESITERLTRPLDVVGVYVPGGQAPLLSTVLMTVIPAKIAGVPHIVVATPPGEDGRINPHVCAVCTLCGVDTILKAGGAQAIAALAYGTESVKKVDKIVGPGNIYVTVAKKEVYGVVDLDMVAGPSEILIVADDTARPDWVAADLLSQAEHDTMAASVLVCFSEVFAQSVDKEIKRLLQTLSTRETAQVALDRQGCIFIVENRKEAVAIVNAIAPEHLELFVENPRQMLPDIKHAGAVFLGPYSPEAIGDYIAGPSHVLPTAGTARYFSPLSVQDFYTHMSVIAYDKHTFASEAPYAERIAVLEGLDAHALSLSIRRD